MPLMQKETRCRMLAVKSFQTTTRKALQPKSYP